MIIPKYLSYNIFENVSFFFRVCVCEVCLLNESFMIIIQITPTKFPPGIHSTFTTVNSLFEIQRKNVIFHPYFTQTILLSHENMEFMCS